MCESECELETNASEGSVELHQYVDVVQPNQSGAGFHDDAVFKSWDKDVDINCHISIFFY